MALLTLALTGFALQVNYAALDTNSKLVERVKNFELDVTGVDDAAKRLDAATKAAAFLPLFAAVMEADITGYRLSEIQGTADTVTAVATPHKEAVLTLQSAAASSKKLTHSIPAPADAILVNGSTVDAGNAAVGSYLGQFMAANGFRISDGEAIASVTPLLKSRVKMVSSGRSF